MDMSLEYLLEAQGYIEQFITIPFSDSFFEETDKNSEPKKGAINSIKNAIKVLIDKIKEAIQDIKDWVQSKFMSKEERNQYKLLKEQIKKDKELANTKIAMEQWEPYEKLYDDALKTLDEEMKKDEPDTQKINGKMAAFEKAIKDLGIKTGTAAGRAASVISLRTAVDIADRNAICAKAINIALNNELVDLEQVEKIIGSEQLAKYENKIRKYANNGFLHRMKVKILYRKKATLKAVMNKQKKRLLSYTNIGTDGKVKGGKSVISSDSIRKGIITNPGYTSDLVGGVDNMATINKTIRDVEQTKKSVKKSAKQTSREIDDLKAFFK